MKYVLLLKSISPQLFLSAHFLAAAVFLQECQASGYNWARDFRGAREVMRNMLEKI